MNIYYTFLFYTIVSIVYYLYYEFLNDIYVLELLIDIDPNKYKLNYFVDLKKKILYSLNYSKITDRDYDQNNIFIQILDITKEENSSIMTQIKIDIILDKKISKKKNIKNNIFDFILFLKKYDLHITKITDRYSNSKIYNNILPIKDSKLYKLQLIQNKFIKLNNLNYKKDKPNIKLILNNAKLNKMIGYSDLEIIEKIIFECTIFNVPKTEIRFIIKTTSYLDKLQNFNLDHYINSVSKKALNYKNKNIIFLSGLVKIPGSNNYLLQDIKLKQDGDECINDHMCKNRRCINNVCCKIDVSESCVKCLSKKQTYNKNEMGKCIKTGKNYLINKRDLQKNKKMFYRYGKNYFKHKLSII